MASVQIARLLSVSIPTVRLQACLIPLISLCGRKVNGDSGVVTPDPEPEPVEPTESTGIGIITNKGWYDSTEIHGLELSEIGSINAMFFEKEEKTWLVSPSPTYGFFCKSDDQLILPDTLAYDTTSIQTANTNGAGQAYDIWRELPTDAASVYNTMFDEKLNSQSVWIPSVCELKLIMKHYDSIIKPMLEELGLYTWGSGGFFTSDIHSRKLADGTETSSNDDKSLPVSKAWRVHTDGSLSTCAIDEYSGTLFIAQIPYPPV